LKRKLAMEQQANNVKLQVESGDKYTLMEMEHQAPIDVEREVQRKQKKAEYKSKRIPSIFNDSSPGSCICLRRHIYMSHVNTVQPIRVKNMDSCNTCDLYMCSLRHIHDPVLLSLKMEGIRLLFSANEDLFSIFSLFFRLG
jgi:hypothetical protein